MTWGNTVLRHLDSVTRARPNKPATPAQLLATPDAGGRRVSPGGCWNTRFPATTVSYDPNDGTGKSVQTGKTGRSIEVCCQVGCRHGHGHGPRGNGRREGPGWPGCRLGWSQGRRRSPSDLPDGCGPAGGVQGPEAPLRGSVNAPDMIGGSSFPPVRPVERSCDPRRQTAIGGAAANTMADEGNEPVSFASPMGPPRCQQHGTTLRPFPPADPMIPAAGVECQTRRRRGLGGGESVGSSPMTGFSCWR